MELNIKKAFKSPFSQEKWYIKLIFPFVVTILSFLLNNWKEDNQLLTLAVLLLLMIPQLILNGFFTKFANNEIHEQEPLLPQLIGNVQKFFLYGIKLLGVMIVYLLAFLPILIITIISLVIIGTLMDKTGIPYLMMIIFLPILVFLTCYQVLVEGLFNDNFNFKQALDYKKAYRLLTKVKSEIVKYILFFIGFTIIAAILESIIKVLPLAMILAAVPVIIGQLASVNLKAQIYKIAKLRLEQ